MQEENQSTKKYLFLFTISPVQSFIAQARKTQDLYAGSQILSELVKKAIRTTLSYNGKVIFPFVENEKELDNMQSSPNRFIAEINCEAIDQSKIETYLNTVGKTIEKNTKSKFLDIADDIFTDVLKLDKELEKNQKLWNKYEKQINQHLDINWLFIPFTDENYSEKFEEIEKTLGAIKNVRTFEQNSELGRKCSIDGEKNVLFCAKGSKNKLKIKPIWKNLNEQEEKIVKDFNSTIKEIYKGNLTQFEGLSAVSVVKRLYKEETFEKFPSTAQIALMDDIEKLEPKEKEVFDCYQNLFKKDKLATTCVEMFSKNKVDKVNIENLSENENWQHNFDYQLLFEENLTDSNIANNQQLELLKILFKEIKSKLKTRYYALISFDVDSMGKWLSGKEIKDKTQLRKFHEILSKQLILFAKEARNYLDTTKGRTIYAGGDDFLGFVNIKHLFQIMEDLRTLFDEIVNCDKVTNYIESSKKLSFSAGVVVAHYKMPLGNVLEWAKAMEHEAKDFDSVEKDCFSIAVLKKSGEVIKTSSKWKDYAGNYLTVNMSNLHEQLKKGKNKEQTNGFSHTFIKSISKELFLFDNYQQRSEVNVDLKNILDCEMPRLMKRSCLTKNKEDKNNEVKDLYEDLDSFYWSNSSNSSKAMPNFLSMLNISDFLTRKINQE